MPEHHLTLEQVPARLLAPYHRNPRRGNIAVIAESLSVSGQYRPIVVNRGGRTGRRNEVLAGNHTLAAAKSLGWDTVAACYVDVDDEHAAKIVAADNRTADLGDYDLEALVELLGDLDDLDGTGYTDDDIARLLDPGLTENDEGKDDETPASGHTVVIDCDTAQDAAHTRERLTDLGFRVRGGDQ